MHSPLSCTRTNNNRAEEALAYEQVLDVVPGLEGIVGQVCQGAHGAPHESTKHSVLWPCGNMTTLTINRGGWVGLCASHQ